MPYHLSEEQKQEFYMVLEEVCNTSRILESHCYIQHGTTRVFRHSVSVAYLSYYLAQKMRTGGHPFADPGSLATRLFLI